MKYVVAGAGPAGVIGAETLRKADPEGAITMISAEDEPPYSRMAIPYYLSGNVEEKGTFLRKEEDHFQKLNIDYVQGNGLARVSPSDKRVVLEDGSEMPYDRLLIATGSRPTTPPVPGIDLPGIQPCWTLEHARKIHKVVQHEARVVLIGAGFIGSIIIDAIGALEINLTALEMEDRMLHRMMNSTGGEIIKKWCQNKGVNVLTSTRLESIEAAGADKFILKLDSGETLEADLVITATGVQPIMDFLEGSGIETGEGVLVNDRLQTSVPDIYAAGDVAEGKDFSLGDRSSVHAIQPTAAEHARVAALNMTGADIAYRGSLSMNVVDTLGLVHYTFGQWMGIEGGDHAEFMDEAHSQYLRLEFSADILVGAINIGPFEHVGILRGLIQNRIALGEWKQAVLENPKKIMEAYLSVTQSGQVPPRMSAAAT